MKKILYTELTNAIYPGKEEGLQVFFHSMCLEERFISESSFPSLQTRLLLLKIFCISSLPDYPCCNDDCLHKEGMCKVYFGFFHHLKEGQTVIPMDAQTVPALPGEDTVKEKMKSCFLLLLSADSAAVIISLYIVIFPS